ncbi:MAG: DUF2189 domain-containing protein [Burkholderiaceae bacterium]|nr:DUF2189 domain-containing protein [Burkholderiaceae bacterium]
MSTLEPIPEPEHPFPVVRTGLPLSAPFDWLRLGAADLRACGLPSLFYGLSFAIAGALLWLSFRHAIQLVTAITTGFMLVGPFFAIGLYELSRRRENSEPLELIPTLAVWRKNLSCMGIYSLILIVLYLIWARASMIMFALFYQGGMPTLKSFMVQILKFDNIEFLLAYLAVGGIFAGLVFAFSVVSIPMMLDRGQDTITAMIASFLALVRNLPVMLVWGALIVLLTALGIAAGFVGLALTMPLVGHATWHAYRALIEPKTP